ncbi:unnamed protein product [Leptidea sinapis]|uniref:Uncharacterized protein n=1 Tax=Leptidea sinapis TaxID=189913 RepID=A0A5E4QP80_9NEOP|nr:unnamed protein product [Leptidea sinapis]
MDSLAWGGRHYPAVGRRLYPGVFNNSISIHINETAAPRANSPSILTEEDSEQAIAILRHSTEVPVDLIGRLLDCNLAGDFVNARLSHKKIHNRNQPINNFGSSYSSFDLTEEVVDSFYKSDEFKALSNTSDSFIRKRVTEKDLVPSCCTLTKDIRYEGLLKPLMKIIVIPNLKLFKHINTRKYFRSSASNENNSIDREVCYISQKGRKNRKENIYAIKLSESVNDYRKNHHEQMHIEQNYKQLLDSMNMDKNFKRNRKKERHDEHETRSRDIQRNRSTSKDRTPHADPSKSRVTIFGQLGLNENDQFVLNCAATVSRDNQNNGRRISKLSARDSLEISQRRGMHSITSPGKLKTSKRDQQIGEANHSGLSNDPKKHYTGDNCSLEDPIERDKEIRELLGLLTRSKDDTKICQSKDCNEFKGSDKKCECFKIFRT